MDSTAAVVLAQLVLVSGANFALVNYLIKPFKDTIPENSQKWLVYVPLVTGAIVTWFTGRNLFTEIVPTMNPLAGQIFTAVLAGCGNDVLYNLFGRKPEVVETVVKK